MNGGGVNGGGVKTTEVVRIWVGGRGGVNGGGVKKTEMVRIWVGGRGGGFVKRQRTLEDLRHEIPHTLITAVLVARSANPAAAPASGSAAPSSSTAAACRAPCL